jgi:coenzyme F420-0:L-glutamate ligase/coenzyme F420-1:gamma-L-glutamate ligase
MGIVNGQQITLVAIPDIPLIRVGDDLAQILLERMDQAGIAVQHGDVLVICKKIVSKAEGRVVALREVTPSAEAQALAAETGKDARLVELILRESRAILRRRPQLLIAEHRLGWICANAGIDRGRAAAARGPRPVRLPSARRAVYGHRPRASRHHQ